MIFYPNNILSPMPKFIFQILNFFATVHALSSQCAAVKYNSQFKKYHHDGVSTGMLSKKALIKVATKIARIMYPILNHKTIYNESGVFSQVSSPFPDLS